MNAIDLLTELRRRGLELRPDGERLLYRPKGAVTPELAAAIRAHKPELLALLSQEAQAELALERKAIQAEANIPLTGETRPSRWSRLADSGLHHNDVADHTEVIFLFACELILDPSKAREDCRILPAMWAYYSPHWRDQLAQEAFEELEARYRRRLADLGLEEEARPPQGPRTLRPLTLNPEGTGCAVCGGEDYWVMAKGVRCCLICHPAFYKDIIAVGTLPATQEELSRPSMRRRAGGGRATR